MPERRSKTLDYVGPITCRICGVERPHTDYYVQDRRRRRTDCKFCCNVSAKKSVDKIQFGDERWRKRRSTVLRHKYGITSDDFDRMLNEQDGLCAICRSVPKPWREHTRTGRIWAPLVVDHDHETGRVRGLLCFRCNNSMSFVDAVGLQAVTDYLAEPATP